MKQVVSRESGPRSVPHKDGTIYLLPGQPQFLDEDQAKAVSESGLDVVMTDMSMKSVMTTAEVAKESTRDVAPATPESEPVEEDDGLHECPFCEDGREFDTPQGLASHIRAKHPGEYEEWKAERDSG